jgi:hypothetical protein
MVVLLKILVTVIIGQTLFFKFSGAAESMYIFSQLGAEPYGRIGLGVIELISIVLIWWPKTVLYGVLLVFGMMLGAIASHVLILGIEVQQDGGKLFLLAVITLLADLGLVYYYQAAFKLWTASYITKR